MTKLNETGAHRILVDEVTRRAGFAVGCEVEHYTDGFGGTKAIPVLKMSRGDIEHRKQEARVMHRAFILRERRKASTIGARAPETHRLDTVSERDQSAIESGVWPKYTP